MIGRCRPYLFLWILFFCSHFLGPAPPQGGRSLGRNLLCSDVPDWPAGGRGLAGRLPDSQTDQSDEAGSLQSHCEYMQAALRGPGLEKGGGVASTPLGHADLWWFCRTSTSSFTGPCWAWWGCRRTGTPLSPPTPTGPSWWEPAEPAELPRAWSPWSSGPAILCLPRTALDHWIWVTNSKQHHSELDLNRTLVVPKTRSRLNQESDSHQGLDLFRCESTQLLDSS